MLERRKSYGETASAFGVEITPESESLRYTNRFLTAIWNRPTGVIVREGERIYRVPIVDQTRLLQILLLVISLISLSMVGIGIIKERRQ
jgi:hypothetical protein